MSGHRKKTCIAPVDAIDYASQNRNSTLVFDCKQEHLTLLIGNELNESHIYKAVDLDKLIYPDHFAGKLEKCFGWYNSNKET